MKHDNVVVHDTLMNRSDRRKGHTGIYRRWENGSPLIELEPYTSRLEKNLIKESAERNKICHVFVWKWSDMFHCIVMSHTVYHMLNCVWRGRSFRPGNKIVFRFVGPWNSSVVLIKLISCHDCCPCCAVENIDSFFTFLALFGAEEGEQCAAN